MVKKTKTEYNFCVISVSIAPRRSVQLSRDLIGREIWLVSDQSPLTTDWRAEYPYYSDMQHTGLTLFVKHLMIVTFNFEKMF